MKLQFEGDREQSDAAFDALAALGTFNRPNKLAALQELVRRLINGQAKVGFCVLGFSGGFPTSWLRCRSRSAASSTANAKSSSTVRWLCVLGTQIQRSGTTAFQQFGPDVGVMLVASWAASLSAGGASGRNADGRSPNCPHDILLRRFSSLDNRALCLLCRRCRH